MSEKYRRAIRDKDFTAAGQAIMEAVQGDYDSRAVHSLHAVHRMDQDDRNAPDQEENSGVIPHVTVESRTTIWSRMRGGR